MLTTKIAFRDAEHNYITNRFSLSYIISHKFNSKNSIVVGTNNSLTSFNLFDKKIYGGGVSEKINLDQRNNIALIQAYVQWQHRFSENFLINTGMHFQTLTLNKSGVIEPRIGLKYITANKNIFALVFISTGLYLTRA